MIGNSRSSSSGHKRHYYCTGDKKETETETETNLVNHTRAVGHNRQHHIPLASNKKKPKTNINTI